MGTRSRVALALAMLGARVLWCRAWSRALWLRWLPCGLLLRSRALCHGKHLRVATWERKLGADWPTGFRCPRCSRHVDLYGRFTRWMR